MNYIILFIAIIAIVVFCYVSESNKYKNKIINFYNNLSDIYISHSMCKNIKEEYFDLYTRVCKVKIKQYKLIKFIYDYENLENVRSKYNKKFIKKELISNKEFFDNINGCSLDNAQRIAVITNEDNNLIVAGAGSGKTLTMIAKIKYLIEIKGVDAKKILCISFTKDATNNIKKKCRNNLVSFLTFHGLGKKIIEEYTGTKLDISLSDLEKIVNDFFKKDVLNNEELKKKIIDYFGYYFYVPSKDNKCLADKYEKEAWYDFETFRSKVKYKNNKKIEKVRNIEELIIANFLYLNSINYEYNANKISGINNYKFYLKDHDMYIDCSNKNSLNKENIKIIKMNTYFNSNIIKDIESALILNKIVLKSRNMDNIYRKLINETSNFNELYNLIIKFIKLFKANNFNLDDIENFINVANSKNDEFVQNRELIFLEIIKNIYVKYEKYLNENNKIDFDDMLNLATRCLNDNYIPSNMNYDYVIIDEYQDTSISRYSLINALKKLTNAKIIAVGDDFQSIFRFTGCNLDIFVNFNKYFSNPKIMKIENTYRNSYSLIKVAGDFIMKNDNQIKKNLKSNKELYKPIIIYYYDSTNYKSILKKSVDNLIINLKTKSIYIIGRNHKDLNEVLSTGLFKIKKVINNQTILEYIENKDIYIKFSTVHSSKGLEDENVIIINLKNSQAGFPNKMSDDEILNYVTNNKENYLYEEERRLFYVALTRTRNTVSMLVPINSPSIFVREIIEDNKMHINVVN